VTRSHQDAEPGCDCEGFTCPWIDRVDERLERIRAEPTISRRSVRILGIFLHLDAELG